MKIESDYTRIYNKLMDVLNDCYDIGLTPLSEQIEDVIDNLEYCKDNGYVLTNTDDE